jgi:protocatechuate 3,4-dioxygenase beta subunit
MHRRDLLLLGVAALAVPAGHVRAGPRDAPPPRRARPDLYQCEGCEGALERDPKTLSSSARIGPGLDRGEPLRLTGTVYRADGKTPAPGVVLYAYQTNAEGLYANGSPGTEASRRHGRLRGWLATGPDGRYSFDTIKPAPYPHRTLPAHVHFTVLEPGRRPYWIDDVVFSGEFGVTDAYRKAMTNKGGDGIVTLGRDPDGTLVARRDIVLEVHPD